MDPFSITLLRVIEKGSMCAASIPAPWMVACPHTSGLWLICVGCLVGRRSCPSQRKISLMIIDRVADLRLKSLAQQGSLYTGYCTTKAVGFLFSQILHYLEPPRQGNHRKATNADSDMGTDTWLLRSMQDSKSFFRAFAAQIWWLLCVTHPGLL